MKPLAATPGSVRAERRLDRASQHVSDLWFPVNEGLLSDIQSQLNEGKYGDAALLVQDIRSDFSLFTYCLRELSSMLRESESGVTFPSELNPVALLEWAGIERLKKILSVSPAEVSSHTLKGVSPERITRFQEAMVSATTCESLSESYSIDPDLAYSAALMRQLGITLVAWNYEDVYKSAVNNLSPGQSLDAAITQRLGFSPSMLAVKVVQSWILPEEVAELMDAQDIQEEDIAPGGSLEKEFAEVRNASNALLTLCEVGEALARANSDIKYPSAKEDWERAQRTITETLGPDAVKILQEAVLDNCERYFERLPHVFRGSLVIDPEAKLHASEEGTLIPSNPYLTVCLPEVQDRIIELYVNRLAGDTRQSNLSTLRTEIVLQAGFTRGCLFTIEPSTMLLVPQLAMGGAKTQEYKPVAYWETRPAESTIEEAFRNGGYVQGVVTNDGIPTSITIASPLGNAQRIGVLVLEMDAKSYQANSKQHLLHFKAILQTLSDSLMCS